MRVKALQSFLVWVVAGVLVLIVFSCSTTYKTMNAASNGYKTYFEGITSTKELDIQDKSGKTALMTACDHMHKELVGLLLSKGADPNLKDNQLNTVLHFAARNGSLEMTQMLIDKNAAITSNSDDLTPLHLATRTAKGNIELTLLLINKGADINHKSKITGETPLLNAMLAGNDQLIDLLVLNGANTIDRDKYNVTTYMLAAKSNKLKMIYDLSGKGMQVNEKAEDGMTVLHYAAMSGNREMIEYLISQGADIHAKTKAGETVIGLAVKSKIIGSVETLLSNKADVNSRCAGNYTPLMYALFGNNREMVQLLLDNKANVNLFADNLTSPASIVAENKNPGLLDLLTSYGCTLNLFSDPGFYPIKMAVGKKCDEGIMNLLFDCETNYVAASSLLPKIQTIKGDSLKNLNSEIEQCLKKSLDEIDKRKGEYNRKIATKVAGNIGSAIMTTALNIGSTALPENVSVQFGYRWDSNEFNRAMLRTLQQRAGFLENKIRELKAKT